MDKNVEVLIRELLRDEYDAVASYEEATLNAHNPRVEKVLRDIKEEEIVHIGELQALLNEIGVNDDSLIAQGAEEAFGELTEATKTLIDTLKEFND